MGKDQRRKQHGLDVRRNRREREARAVALLRREWAADEWDALPEAPPLVPAKDVGLLPVPEQAAPEEEGIVLHTAKLP